MGCKAPFLCMCGQGGPLTVRKKICGLGSIQCPPLVVLLFLSWSLGQSRLNLQLLYPGGQGTSTSCLSFSPFQGSSDCRRVLLHAAPCGRSKSCFFSSRTKVKQPEAPDEDILLFIENRKEACWSSSRVWMILNLYLSSNIPWLFYHAQIFNRNSKNCNCLSWYMWQAEFLFLF